ncbi:related to GYP1 - cis-golgi GTPase-activating protein [Ustilago sp. UG-2017a]|nr:related to GYP1 - cis-golgi GTPase-activating protein [Ustilago sp. UG-2017a]
MSSAPARSGNAASRDRSLHHLLDPNDLLPGHTTADSYSLRHFTLRGGLPDSPSWLRAQAWKVLLGYLPPEKKEWSSTLAKQRRDYYQFLRDLLPPASSSDQPLHASQLTNNDRLLDQIYKDLVRSRKNGFAFYQASPRPSASCPIVPLPDAKVSSSPQASRAPVERLQGRDSLLHRLAAVSHEYAQQLSIERLASASTSTGSRQPPKILHVQTSSDLKALQGPAATNGYAEVEDAIKSPPILLSPPSPGGVSQESSQHPFASAADALEASTDTEPSSSQIKAEYSTIAKEAQDGALPQRNWHSLLRILYMFALLNPSIGYVQGMNEALFTLLYVFGSAQYPTAAHDTLTPSSSQQSIATVSDRSNQRPWDNDVDLADLNTHAEADAFWCFSALIGEMRELYDFERVEQQSRAGAALVDHQPSQSGMAGALRRFSLRIKWLDPPFWRDLQTASLDPRLPYFSLRWLACLLSTEFSLPSVLRIWDALLAEQETAGVSGSAKIEFLIDFCASMMLTIKDRLPSSSDKDVDLETEGFSFGMRVLQEYPDDDIEPLMESATLIRQRRLAADLTGDGPPDDDEEEESNPRLAAVKARAAQAWRDWKTPRRSSTNKVTSPRTVDSPDKAAAPLATKGGWLVSRARGRPSLTATDEAGTSIASSTGDIAVSDISTPSKSSFGGFLAKYAEAVQSSDAAANFSKASTNLTAKAMARFSDRGSRESTPDSGMPYQGQPYGSLGRGFPSNPTASAYSGAEPRIASFGSIGASFFNRQKRNASESHSQSVGGYSPRTPDMTRWSRDTMPDFPLPNVSDSPARRMEYTDTFGRRISMAQHARGASPASSVTGDDSERRSENGISNFPLPSMRAAARMGILPARYREESISPGGRAVGPKPLLLSQSARPPREGSNSPGSLAVDEPSRKISSGPMGHSMSRGNSHQDSRSISSFSGRSSATGSRRSSVADFGETSMPGLAEEGALPPLPSLMGQSVYTYPLGTNAADTGGSLALQGAISKEGTVSAGAFTRATKIADADRERPEFGQVASSSDVPLVATGASISRPRASHRKRTSSSTVESRTASTSGSMTGNQLSNRSSQTTSVVDGAAIEEGWEAGEVITVEEPASLGGEVVRKGHQTGRSDGSSSTWHAAEAIVLTDEPLHGRLDTVASAATAAPFESGDTTPLPQTVRKYTLTDEPLPQADTPLTATSSIIRTKRFTKNRQNSSSSTTSRRSLAGLRRSSRNSLTEQAPTSPVIALPEVMEADAYGGIAADSGVNGEGELPFVSARGVSGTGHEEYPGSPSLDDSFNIGSLNVANGVESGNRRPSTDRSGFI